MKAGSSHKPLARPSQSRSVLSVGSFHGYPFLSEWIQVGINRVVATESLCEDCNECGCVCPDGASSIPLEKVTFSGMRVGAPVLF
jgi:hypothetical protein